MTLARGERYEHRVADIVDPGLLGVVDPVHPPHRARGGTARRGPSARRPSSSGSPTSPARPQGGRGAALSPIGLVVPSARARGPWTWSAHSTTSASPHPGEALNDMVPRLNACEDGRILVMHGSPLDGIVPGYRRQPRHRAGSLRRGGAATLAPPATRHSPAPAGPREGSEGPAGPTRRRSGSLSSSRPLGRSPAGSTPRFANHIRQRRGESGFGRPTRLAGVWTRRPTVSAYPPHPSSGDRSPNAAACPISD
jgi:hypothetical protein